MRREFFSGPCLCGTARIEPRLWLEIPENARSVGEIGGDLLGDRKGASEARRLDAEEGADGRQSVRRRAPTRKRWTMRASPCCPGPSTKKSAAASPGPVSFGLMPQ